MDQKEQVTMILEQIEDGVHSVFESDSWKTYLKTMSQFHHYSISNSLLIYLQKPQATYVAGFQTWKNKFNRYVRKGEKAIRILAPLKKMIEDENNEEILITGFRCASVFDISQTKGDPLPEYMKDALQGKVENYDTFLRALRLSSPVPVSLASFSSHAHGYYDPDEKQILIKNDMSEIMTVKTCVHEIAHAILHAKESGRENISKFQKETEAESVAYAVCAYYGIDTEEYSFPYIAGWSQTHSTKELESVN